MKHLLRDAVARHRAGRLQEAAGLYRQVLAAEPKNADALHLLGLVEREAGRLDKAAGLVRRAVRLRPANPTFLFNLAIIARDRGDLEEALSCYRKAAELDPKNPQLHNNLGVALGENGDLVGAAAAFREALRHAPDMPEAMVNLADTLQRTGLSSARPEAERLARRAVALSPGVAAAHAALAEALPLPDGGAAAVAAARRASELAPAEPAHAERLARLNLQAGLTDAAVAAAQQAIALAPEGARARVTLGRALLAQGRMEEAVAALRAALDCDPKGVGVCEAAAASELQAALMLAGQRQAAAELQDLDHLVFTHKVAVPPGYKDIDAFNRTLAEAIRTHDTLRQDPEGYVTRDGAITENVLLDGQPVFQAMEWSLRRAIAAFTGSLRSGRAHYFRRDLKRRYRMVMWGVVLDRAGHLETHMHDDSWISGAYYVSLPRFDRGPGEDHAGAIEFGRPPATYGIAPPFPTRVVEPEEGMVVLFPAATFHRTVPFRADAARICISFNCQPY
ncbi:tetratricopeptide repeat protein [Marinibaculum pumilum]|uniref:Tetratricopeptide repeat protein n=1 Tax=Marinibaculum pumilum TaxID=1766165 RepID=A0ABV7L9I2_9PROT